MSYKMEAILCVFLSSNYTQCHLSSVKGFSVLFVLMPPFTNTKLLKKTKQPCCHEKKVFEIHGAYINKFACVYSVSLLDYLDSVIFPR